MTDEPQAEYKPMSATVITMIGILLAECAKLMVIFYGGDAFRTQTITGRFYKPFNPPIHNIPRKDRYHG